MGDVGQAQASAMASDMARTDGIKLLAKLLRVPQIEVARRAFDRLLCEHRELLLAEMDAYFGGRKADLGVLLSRSLEDIRAAETPAIEVEHA